MIVLFLAFSIPPDWVYLNAKTAQDRHTQRGIEMDNKVLDEAVEVAQRAWRELIVKDAPSSQEAMRAALLAGVKVLLGEPVAWQLIDANGKPVFLPYLHKAEAEGMVAFYQDDSQLRKQDQEVFTIRDLYAPSLGEGDVD